MKTRVMKTWALWLGIMLAGAPMANATGKTGEASKVIGSHVKLPNDLRKAGVSEKVTVYFSVNEQGQVREAYAFAKTRQLAKHIEQQFSTLKLTGLLAGETYSIVLNFKIM